MLFFRCAYTAVKSAGKKINLDKKRTCILLAVLISILILIFSLYVFGFRYQTNDDTTMAKILSGAYGEYSAYTVFINFIIGKPLQMLYLCFPEINWYSYFHLSIIVIACSEILYVFFRFRKNNATIKISLALIAVFIAVSSSMPSFNFTQNSGLITIASLLLILQGMKNSVKTEVLVGAFSFIIGTFIRIDSALMVMPFIAIIIVIEILSLKNIIEIKKQCLRYLAVFFPLLIIALGCNFMNAQIDKEYSDFTKARAAIVDYPIPDYSQHKEEFDRIGISENDLKMLETWTFDDPEIFNTEKLIQVSSIREVDYLLKSRVKDVVSYTLNYLTSNEFGVYFGVLFILFLFFDKKKPIRKISYLFSLGVLVLLMYYYFMTIGRVLGRVEYCIWVAVILNTTYFMDLEFTNNKIKAFKISTCIVLVYVFCNFGKYLDSYKLQKGKQELTIDIIEEKISRDKSSLYVLDTRSYGSIDVLQNYPFESVEYGKLSNITYFGTWLTKLPIINKIHENYGVDNLLKDVVNDNVIIADKTDIGIKLEYIKQHYYPNAECYKVKEHDQWIFYKFFDGPIHLDREILKEEFVHKVDIKKESNIVKVDGEVYNNVIDSFEQTVYIKIINLDHEEYKIIPAISKINEQFEINSPNSFSKFYLDFELDEECDYRIEFILEDDNMLYEFYEEEIIA